MIERYRTATHLHSFPTRRSSDLICVTPSLKAASRNAGASRVERVIPTSGSANRRAHRICTYSRSVTGDRKSTRLNSSHVEISYAVFCLKKKTCCCFIKHIHDFVL